MFDLEALGAAIAAHGRVARVVIAAHDGSSPREVGASMLVWPTGQAGTIGGGALEFSACATARAFLAANACPTTSAGGDGAHPAGSNANKVGRDGPAAAKAGEGWGPAVPTRVDRVALGPSLGQCCGGAVTLWTEVHDMVPAVEAGVVLRGPGAMPLAASRILTAARGQGVRPAAGLVAGWMIEPVTAAERAVWVWGAGHVGRALVSVLAPLPGVAVTWVDTGPERFPDNVPAGVRVLPVAAPEAAVSLAAPDAEHLVVTFSHALDLELCHRILGRGFRSCGLIGSATKWARFRSRLQALGHAAEAISRISCPIGDPALGKHPQAIAVGVAAEFLAAFPAKLPAARDAAIRQRGRA